MIAGPNGSGKTTLTRWLRERDIDFGKYINPDDIADQLKGSYKQRTMEAQKIADQRREACIEAKESFTFETVMSHPSKIDILARAREAGFFVQLFFVGTDDPQTNIERVALRVAQGGHDVPEDKIATRWKRTMGQLSEAIRSSDQVFVFDNSAAGTVETIPRLVFRRSPTKGGHRPWSEHHPPVPNWVQQYVLTPLGIGFPNVYSDSTGTSIRQSIVSLPNFVNPVPVPESELHERVETEHSGGMQRFSQALFSAVDKAAQAYVRDGASPSLLTGFRDLDRVFGGLQSSDLVIIAAHPGVGKTTLATNIAYNVASAWQGKALPDGNVVTTKGGVVGFFSFEMSAEQIATRIISAKSGIPSDQIFNGGFTTDGFERIADIAKDIQKIPLYIDDTGGVSISQFITRAEQLKRQHGLDLLVIDTVQMLQRATERATGVSSARASTIIAGLKSLTKELGVPILAVSQLTKPKILRDRRPQLTDLDQSFEQNADVVLFIFREDYWLQMEEPTTGSYQHLQWQTDMGNAWGRAEIIIAKNRHGRTGTVQVQFDAATTLFSDLGIR